ncbi:MAG: PIN domain-containing protein [Telluria sp.]
MTYLVDTNVLSELRRKSPAPQVLDWFSQRPASTLYLSVLTFGEIRKGIELLSDTQRKAELSNWLSSELTNYFAGRILSIDLNVCERWARMLASVRSPVPAIDSLIAATAAEHGLILVTRNVKDFSAFPITTLNPWPAA